MTGFLIKLFVKNKDSTSEQDTRTAYGTLAGITGIILNILLSLVKGIAGIVSGSLSVTADAVNNLSDASSSIVTLLGFRMAKKPPDKDHPFGHARFEYISGLAVAAAILIVGFQLGKVSVEKIIRPSPAEFSVWIWAVLGIAAAVKVWLYVFYKKIGEVISSYSLKASAYDSRNDAVTTLSVMAGGVIYQVTGVDLDGWLGLLVAVFIFVSGISAAKKTISPLLGEPADKKLVEDITLDILNYDSRILGIHDLVVHDYGAARRFASVHVEMNYKTDVLEAHDLLDEIERMICEKYRVQTVIHWDPVITDDDELNDIRQIVMEQVMDIDERLSFHDLRIVRRNSQQKLVLDLTVPDELKNRAEDIKLDLEESLKKAIPDLQPIVTLDTCGFA